VNNPERIVRSLDRHLTRPTRLILYGRAALALGFPGAGAGFGATLDVDAILPEVEMAAIEADQQFWDAIEAANRELEPGGLYLTHLFGDSQVILSAGWLGRLLSIPLSGLRHLRLWRPSTQDLILTKMMRVDPQDREDLRFLLGQEPMDPGGLARLMAAARVPDIAEIREAFGENAQWLRGLVEAGGPGPVPGGSGSPA
jgi:hypothetical protein